MNRTISYERSQTLRSTGAATAPSCITCTVICTIEGAQLSDTSDSSCDSLFDTGGLFLGGCSTGGGGGGGWKSPGGAHPGKKRKDFSTCSPISAALWPASNLTVNVHPVDTEVLLYSSDNGEDSPGGSVAVRGTSSLLLTGAYDALNVSVESGTTIKVDKLVSLRGKLTLVGTSNANIPPVFGVGSGSVLQIGEKGALSLDGFGSFEVAATGQLVVDERERGSDALVRIVRREPSSATFIDLSGEIVWDRPENDDSLLVASVRQIGTGSISQVVFGGVYTDSLNNTLVPMEVNGTGDEVKVVLMYQAPEDGSMSTLAASGPGMAQQGDAEGDYTVALIVAVVALILCLGLCIGVVIRRWKNDAAKSAARSDAAAVPGRAAQYYEPEMLQSHLVGVRVMGKDAGAPQTRASRSSSRYFKPPAAAGDAGYEAPAVNRRGENGYAVAASGRTSRGGAVQTRASPRRSRQSSLSHSGGVASPRRQYGAVPTGVPDAGSAQHPHAHVLAATVAANRSRQASVSGASSSPPPVPPRSPDTPNTRGQFGASPIGLRGQAHASSVAPHALPPHMAANRSRQASVSGGTRAPPPVPPRSTGAQTELRRPAPPALPQRRTPGTERTPPPPPRTNTHHHAQSQATSPVVSPRYTGLPQTSAHSAFASPTVARTGTFTPVRPPPVSGVAPHPPVRSRSGSSSNVAARRAGTRDSRRMSRISNLSGNLM